MTLPLLWITHLNQKFYHFSWQMNRPLNTKWLIHLTTLHPSRQNKRSRFSSKANIIQKLQNCNDFISATSKHSYFFKSGLLRDTITTNHFINYYKRLEEINYTHQLFDEMPEPNGVSFTSLMASYVDMVQPKLALWLYRRMLENSIIPNDFMLADLRTGKKIHTHVEMFGF